MSIEEETEIVAMMKSSMEEGENEWIYTPSEHDIMMEERRIANVWIRIPAAMSIVCSGYIIYSVASSYQKRSSPTQRILMALSISDVIFSFFMFLGSWPIPEGTENAYGAVGNIQTCTFQGFFLLFHGGVMTPLYNGFLALYIYLFVFRDWGRQQMKRVEIYGHLFVIIFSLTLAVACIPLKLFNACGYGLLCWIGAYPPKCTQSYKITDGSTTDCERGDNADIYKYGVYGSILWIAIIWTFYSMGRVYFHVRNQEKTMAAYTNEYAVRKTNSGSDSRDVAIRGALFTGAFLIAFLAPSIAQVFGMAGIYSFQVHAFGYALVTSQGIFNYFVYIIHPAVSRYLKEKEQRKHIASTQIASDLTSTNVASEMTSNGETTTNGEQEGFENEHTLNEGKDQLYGSDWSQKVDVMAKRLSRNNNNNAASDNHLVMNSLDASGSNHDNNVMVRNSVKESNDTTKNVSDLTTDGGEQNVDEIVEEHRKSCSSSNNASDNHLGMNALAASSGHDNDNGHEHEDNNMQPYGSDWSLNVEKMVQTNRLSRNSNNNALDNHLVMNALAASSLSGSSHHSSHNNNNVMGTNLLSGSTHHSSHNNIVMSTNSLAGSSHHSSYNNNVMGTNLLSGSSHHSSYNNNVMDTNMLSGSSHHSSKNNYAMGGNLLSGSSHRSSHNNVMDRNSVKDNNNNSTTQHDDDLPSLS